jgi:multidrug efflux pump subunit AcrA (membrane-fusion protein)
MGWKIKRLLLAGFLLFTLTACTPRGGDDIPGVPERIRSIAARADTAVVDTGPVISVERHEGITRILSEPLTFGGIGDTFEAFYIASGDKVEQGQLLARLNGEHLTEEIRRITDNIAQIKQDYENENANTLLGRQARERYALALRHAGEDLENLRRRLDAYSLYAPFGGTVTLLTEKQTGQWVPPWETILYIAAEQEVIVEYIGGELRVSSPAQTLRAERITAYIDGNIYDLQQIPITSEIRAYYAVREHNPPIRFTVAGGNPRMGAGAVIMLYTQWVEDALRMPINALFNSPDGDVFAYRIENGAQVQVSLSVGARTASFVEIISGLAEGDEVFVRP